MGNYDLRQLQLSELEILTMFRDFCSEYGLSYYLHAGTLLGAVRHQGFIPWDDDVDIMMPRADYDRLRQNFYSKFPEGFYFQDCLTEANFPYFFSKVRKEGTEVFEPCLEHVNIRKGHYIDILPLDVCPDGRRAGYVYFKIMGFFNTLYMSKVNPGFVCGYVKPYMKLLYRLMRHLPLSTIRSMRQRFSRLPAQFSSGKRLCTVGGVHGFPAETYESAWIKDSVFLSFENEQFAAPAGWHELLSNMYGDYMQAPPPEERGGHFA